MLHVSRNTLQKFQTIYFMIYREITFLAKLKPCALVGLLCFTSVRQRGDLETASLFTIPCEGREAQFLHRFNRELNYPPPLHQNVHFLG